MSSAASLPPASLAALRDRIRQIEAPARHGVLPFEVAAIDRALPCGGLALGAVHGILGQGGGRGRPPPLPVCPPAPPPPFRHFPPPPAPGPLPPQGRRWLPPIQSLSALQG